MRPCRPSEVDEEMEAASAASDLNSRLGVGSTLTPWINSTAAAAASAVLRGGDGSSSEQQAQEEQKMKVCHQIFQRLFESGHVEAVDRPGLLEELQSHFSRLPYRYSLDVNVARAEDVLVHKRLLELAVIPENRPVFNVRAVHMLPVGIDDPERFFELSPMNASPKQGDFFPPDCPSFPWQSSVHPPPSFGSSLDLDAVALKLNRPSLTGEVIDRNEGLSFQKPPHKPMHEVTFSTMDKTKLLSKLSSLLADAGLNIREAHVFCTVDGYSLDVFVVDGWSTEDTEELEHALEDCIAKVEKGFWSTTSPSTSPTQPKTKINSSDVENFKIPTDGSDDWELDLAQLRLNYKVASGSSRDLFRGTYCGQDVAIKVLKPECLYDDLQKEFAQEIFIMRKVRHRNVVQFIGACTKAPNLCIVTEFMIGGSIHDYLHKKKGLFELPKLLMVAMDISKGMDYLHQNNIIHRDLKAANLLMDENGVVKVADFGVSRVQTHSGIMTAETGTYRWMAPEVIEHKPYDRKADVFSFGIVLWELLTGKIPHDNLTPLQAAVGVVQKGLRPIIPEDTHAGLAELLRRCWEQEPSKRPGFSEITVILQEIMKEHSACMSPKT